MIKLFQSANLVWVLILLFSLTSCQKALPVADPDSVAQKSSQEVRQTMKDIKAMTVVCKSEAEKSQGLHDRLERIEKRLVALEAAGVKRSAVIAGLNRQLAACRSKAGECKAAPKEEKEYSPSDAPVGWAPGKSGAGKH